MAFWPRKKPLLDAADITLDDSDPSTQSAGTSSAYARPMAPEDSEESWLSEAEVGQIAEQCALRAISEVDEELRITGQQCTPEQREAMFTIRGQRYALEMMNRALEARKRREDFAELRETLANSERTSRNQEERRHSEIVAAIQNSTHFGRTLHFKREHPLLTGLLGDEIVEKITGQGWWKG